jgi:hypothetical protein
MSPTHLDYGKTKDPANDEHGIGIQSTPVIDPSMERLYFTYRTGVKVSPGVWIVEQHVAALDPHDGSIKLDRNINGDLITDVNGLRQRASLLLSNGILYVAFASHAEDGGAFGGDSRFRYRGQILAFDPNTLRTSGLFQTVPNDKYGGGIWMASSGLAADENGNIYFTSGNMMSVCQTNAACRDATPDHRQVGIDLSPDCQIGASHKCRAVADAAVRLALLLREIKPGTHCRYPLQHRA